MPEVLVVDDDRDMRQVIRVILERSGYSVREAANGVQAIAAYRHCAADAVIMDMFMPEKDGLETLRDLRNIDPDIRVVAMSGGGTLDNVQVLSPAAHLGARRTLLKPFTRDQILAALKDVLS